MDSTSKDLIGIKEVQVFGEKSIKIYGVLGVNYSKSFYWSFEKEFQNSIIQIEGNTKEVDLDGDSKQEIISTIGTIPETEIYKSEEGEILVSNINKSIGAKSVIMSDRDSKLFDVYFEPNKLEQYSYYKGVFKKESYFK
ncbi:hypothetical protein [Wukongibacter sp. M2B1]|uniref:hypothetical protein n=1 Tax=Wukongibacter sp. M2B1 TaxID=3088895 RepID=UPI003D7A13C3